MAIRKDDPMYYRNKVRDLIILSIENVIVKLMLTSRSEEEYRFKQVPNKYY